VLSKYDVMTVGEAIGITLQEEPRIVNSESHELNMVFNFDAVRINRGEHYSERKWKLADFKAIYANHARDLGKSDWDTVFLSNHDNPRLVSNFGDTSTPEARVHSAKMLETMLLTLRGTAFIYQGDELGMTNYPFTRLDQFDDIEVKNLYQEKVVPGLMPEDEFIRECARFGRDNSRTPMQWSSDAHAGFTTASAKPWLAVNPNYTTINAAQEVADHDSVYNYTARLIALRAKTRAFVYGDYKDLDPQNGQVFAYVRTLGNEQYLVVHNFSSEPVEYTLPDGVKAGKIVIDNYAGEESGTVALHLKGWESRVYRQ
jgi:oligo-1,6-glucosidase